MEPAKPNSRVARRRSGGFVRYGEAQVFLGRTPMLWWRPLDAIPRPKRAALSGHAAFGLGEFLVMALLWTGISALCRPHVTNPAASTPWWYWPLVFAMAAPLLLLPIAVRDCALGADARFGRAGRLAVLLGGCVTLTVGLAYFVEGRHLPRNGCFSKVGARAPPSSVKIEAGFTADVVTPEDLLVYKLIAWRHKDRAGIDRLLAVQQSLDWTYVREWARRFGIEARLDAALREAGLPPA